MFNVNNNHFNYDEFPLNWDDLEKYSEIAKIMEIQNCKIVMR